ncbi:MAG TPA: hypothetical protein PLJ47_10850 [Candidatus Hydrogenedentes bacterium]|nr:hypothetical protein [Candidatus Hydrogenedentota bacterium]
MSAFVWCLFQLSQLDVSALTEKLEAARTTYDVSVAESVLAQARTSAPEDLAVLRVRIDAALLVAELHRIAWEQLPESDIAHRRPIGEQIDAAAEEALTVLDKLPEDSERYRIHADLLGVMIRSDFRAKKYRKDMEAHAAKAVALDAKNALAYVSLAKPFVFADVNVGGDPAKAIELLSQAIALAPNLESALCLRGLAYQKANKADLARADWESALAKNPACAPAKRELAKLSTISK